jgi:hypothetical protein
VKPLIQSVLRFSTAAFPLAILAGVLAGPPAAHSQTPSSTVAVAATEPKGLFINILEGEGALNDIRTRTAREPIVEVDDENHKPVAGALVLFAVDNGGGSPFATFAGANTVSVETDAAGRAVARGFQITQRKGKFNIKVHATKGPLEAAEVIAESNIAALLSSQGHENPVVAASHRKLEWIIGGVAAAGVVTGIVIATQQGSSTTITPGTGTVGAPAAIGGIRIQFHPHIP